MPEKISYTTGFDFYEKEEDKYKHTCHWKQASGVEAEKLKTNFCIRRKLTVDDFLSLLNILRKLTLDTF